jgi:hypothetical protein
MSVSQARASMPVALRTARISRRSSFGESRPWRGSSASSEAESKYDALKPVELGDR